MTLCASFKKSEWEYFLKLYRMTDQELRLTLSQKYGIEKITLFPDLVDLPQKRVFLTKVGGENN